MHFTIPNSLSHGYHCICITAAIVLIIFCIYQYSLDQNVTDIEYKRFHETAESMYPSITLCFVEQFVKDKLAQYGQEIGLRSYKDYKHFLSGKSSVKNLTWKAEWRGIDYDKVTVQLKDSLHFIAINFLNGGRVVWRVENGTMIRSDGSSADYPNVQPPKIVFVKNVDKVLFPKKK